MAATAAVHTGRTAGDIVGLIFKIIGTVVLLVLTTGAIFAMIFALYIRTTLEPQIDISLEDFSLELTSVILQREFDDENNYRWVEAVDVESGEVRHWVAYEEMNRYLIYAAVAFEDRRFFEHRGVDWFRTAAAGHTMFLGDGNIFGASTITQQLIKNLTRQDDITIRRKLLEIFRAMELERLYTKEEILEWYLNVISLGGRINGVGAAAEFYYGVDQSELTVAQAASIIGITQFPTRYNPNLNPQYNQRKRDEVLATMYAQGFITRAQYLEALAESVEDHLVRGGQTTFEVPLYTFYEETIINDLIAQLQRPREQGGLDLSLQAARNMVFHGGLRIESAMDPRIQGVVDHYFSTTANLPIPSGAQSAMIIMDHQTGHIVGMGGRVGEKTQNMVLNFATEARRPPGSSFKPISVYGPAMELGILRPHDMLLDAPVMNQGRPWPQNANRVWTRGYQNLVRANSLSTNTTAVRALEMIGVEASYEFLTERLHIQLAPEDADRAPLALGQLHHGLTVREITAAFASFANGGMFIHPTTFVRVLDANGEVLIDNTNPEREVAFRAEIAGQMTAMLLDAVVNGTGRGFNWSGMDVAGKTGSTDAWRDRWFAGYTPHLTASVWSGFEIMHAGGLPGTNPSGVTFRNVMRDAHAAAGLPPARFQNLPSLRGTSEAAEIIDICSDSQLLATDACHNYIGGSTAVPFPGDPDNAPTASCTLHVAMTVCSITDMMPNPTCHLTHTRGFIGGGPGVCPEYHDDDPGDPGDPGDPYDPYDPYPSPTPTPPEPTPTPPEPTPTPPEPTPDPPIEPVVEVQALPPRRSGRVGARSKTRLFRAA